MVAESIPFQVYGMTAKLYCVVPLRLETEAKVFAVNPETIVFKPATGTAPFVVDTEGVLGYNE